MGLINRSARKIGGGKAKYTYREDECLVNHSANHTRKEISKVLGKKEDGKPKRSEASLMWRWNHLCDLSDEEAIKTMEDLKALHIKQGTYDADTRPAITEEDFK